MFEIINHIIGQYKGLTPEGNALSSRTEDHADWVMQKYLVSLLLVIAKQDPINERYILKDLPQLLDVVGCKDLTYKEMQERRT
jgi:hypothetical protein